MRIHLKSMQKLFSEVNNDTNCLFIKVNSLQKNKTMTHLSKRVSNIKVSITFLNLKKSNV